MRSRTWPLARVAAIAAAGLLVSCRVSPAGTLIGPSVGAQPWWFVRSPHFTVQSDVGQTEAREIAVDLEKTYRTLADLAFPMVKDPGLITDVIIFRTADEYKRVGLKGSSGYYNHAFKPWDLGHATFVTYGGISEAARPTFVHELTHQFVHYAFPQAPVWLNEGLAEYFAPIVVADGKAVLGRGRRRFKRGDSWTMGNYGIPIDVLPTLDTMFSMDARTFYAMRETPDDPDEREPSDARKEAEHKQSAAYASAWAMVHVLRGGSPENAAGLEGWLTRMAQGEPVRQAFDESFKHTSIAQLDAERLAFLERHVTGDISLLRTDYDAVGAPPLEDRAMRPAEVSTLWGWAYLHASASGAVEGRRYAEQALSAEPLSAEAHLLEAASIGTDDPRGLEAAIEAAARAEPESEPAAYALFTVQTARRQGAVPSPERKAQTDALLARWLPRAKNPGTLNDFAWYMALHGRAEEAVPVARRATQADPSCADCFDTGAVALFRSGQYKAAIEAESLAAGLIGEGRGSEVFAERVDLFRAVNTAIVLWKKRPEPGKDPSLLPASVLEAFKAAHGPQVRDCYRGRSRKNRKITGAVVVRQEIGKDGKVSAARALPIAEWDALPKWPALPPLPDEAVTECIVETLSSARFPESGAPTTFDATYVFAPSRQR